MTNAMEMESRSTVTTDWQKGRNGRKVWVAMEGQHGVCLVWEKSSAS